MIFSYDNLPECCPIIGDSEQIRFSRDWVFYADKQEIWIPAGYRFECSIPLFAQMFIGGSTNPLFWPAAGAHDFCFETHCLSFNESNNLFNDFLVSTKVPKWKYRLMKFSVATRLGRKAYEDVNMDDLKELKKLVAGREKFERNILVSQYYNTPT